MTEVNMELLIAVILHMIAVGLGLWFILAMGDAVLEAAGGDDDPKQDD